MLRGGVLLRGPSDSASPTGSEETEERLHFDPNGATSGEMNDLVIAPTPDSPWSVDVPANGFVREGYSFSGWSTSPTGSDVTDNPSTLADETLRAVWIPDCASIRGLDCVESADGKHVDADLSPCVRDGSLTLYAQWAPLSPADEGAAPGMDAGQATGEQQSSAENIAQSDHADRNVSPSEEFGWEAADTEQTEANSDAGSGGQARQDASGSPSLTKPMFGRASGQSPGKPSKSLESMLEGKSGVGLEISARLASELGGNDVSARVHMSISSNKSSYEAGSMALVSFEYTIETGAANPGDYILVTIPTDIAQRVSITPDPRMFSGVIDMGNGTYKLTFGEKAQQSLAGGFTAYVTTKNVTTETPGTITSGSGSLTIKVIPTGSAEGSGTYSDAIMKDALDNDGVSYGGYDYSEGMGDNAAQIGIDSKLATSDQTLKYRVYVNQKRATMYDVTVVDTLPDGMVFDTTKTPTVTRVDYGDALDPGSYSLTMTGNKLTFTHPGYLTEPVQITYWVVAGHGSVKYTNRADIAYSSGGQNYQEHRNYVLQSGSYKSAYGEKSVDKTVVSNNPADQTVTYTIKFWNYDGFKVGDINFDDRLDPHVAFLFAEQNPKFKVTYDDATHSVHIENTAALSSSDTEYVRFAVDFSRVPEGHTVVNTVGGNTVKTLKKASISLKATKTVDGGKPGEALAGKFSFNLKDSHGTVLQTKQANAAGDVFFDRMEYGRDDVGKTFTYTVSESGVTEDLSGVYELDPAIYTVTVSPKLVQDGDGSQRIAAVPTIAKDGEAASSITFDNRSKTGSIEISKKVSGTTAAEVGRTFEMRIALTKGGAALDGTYPFKVHDESGKTLSSGTVASGGSVRIAAGQKAEIYGIPAGAAYTVSEASMPGGFTQTASSGAAGTVQAGTSASASFTNSYSASGSFTPSATKRLTGAKLQDGQFTFLLKDDGGNTISTATNKSDGSVTFHEIRYTLKDLGGAASKDFTYTVTEQDDSAAMPGYSFDAGEKTIRVHVADAGDGTITATVAEGSSVPTFNNAYGIELPKAGGPGLVATAIVGLGLAGICAMRLLQGHGSGGHARKMKGGGSK